MYIALLSYKLNSTITVCEYQALNFKCIFMQIKSQKQLLLELLPDKHLKIILSFYIYFESSNIKQSKSIFTASVKYKSAYTYDP